MDKEKSFQYEIDKNFDFVIEESGNTSINLRKISWNNRSPKIDLRKYNYKDGEEYMMKGVSFSDKGADELAAVLVENNYGETKRIFNAIRKRKDFDKLSSDNTDINAEDDSDEDYYDPKQLLLGADNNGEE